MNVDFNMVNLSWAPNVGMVTEYTVLLDLSPQPQDKLCTTLEPYCVTDILVPSTAYYWQVVGTEGGDGPVWTFTTSDCSGDWCPSLDERNEMAFGAQASKTRSVKTTTYSSPLPSQPRMLDDAQSRNVAEASQSANGDNCPTLPPQATSGRACVVLLVHGVAGTDMANAAQVRGWEGLAKDLSRTGYTVEIVSFYGGECHTDFESSMMVEISGAGPNRWMANHHHDPTNPNSNDAWNQERVDGDDGIGCDGVNALIHDQNTNIEHIANHFAWYVHETWTRYGYPVDVIAHSMGGLIVRYALERSKSPQSSGDWPPALDIEDVVTFASPFGGGHFYDVPRSRCKHYAPGLVQIREMCEGSGFLEYLAEFAPNPQGSRGTDWTVMSSYGDEYADQDSAVLMDAHTAIKYNAPLYTHFGETSMYQDLKTDLDADVLWSQSAPAEGESRSKRAAENPADMTGAGGDTRTAASDRIWYEDVAHTHSGRGALESILEIWR